MASLLVEGTAVVSGSSCGIGSAIAKPYSAAADLYTHEVFKQLSGTRKP